MSEPFAVLQRYVVELFLTDPPGYRAGSVRWRGFQVLYLIGADYDSLGAHKIVMQSRHSDARASQPCAVVANRSSKFIGL